MLLRLGNHLFLGGSLHLHKKLLIADQMFSPLTTDAITAFRVCLPELLFVKRASDYIR